MANNGTREKIIEAAYARFYEVGYNATSVQDVVDAAGVPKGNFYNYFKSKELLALEVLKLYAGMADEVFVSPRHVNEEVRTPKARPSVDLLRNQFYTASQSHTGVSFRRGCLMGNFVAESVDLPESLRDLIKESFGRWESAIAAWLLSARKAGEIARWHRPEELSRYIFGAWQGSLLLAKSESSMRPIDNFLDHTFDVLLRTEVLRPKTRGAKTAAA